MTLRDVDVNPARRGRRSKMHYDETKALEVARAWIAQSEVMANKRGNSSGKGFAGGCTTATGRIGESSLYVRYGNA